jgi:hypothetical protein
LLKKIVVYISGCYALDPRALALMRMGVALVVIADLLIRGSDLEAHYTDKGLWPSELMPNFGWQPGFWSLHSLNGSYGWALFLFMVQGLFAFFLLLGYRTRLATLVVWLMTISLHNRNLFVLQSGDDLLRLLLLWGLFLPWQAYYSLDAKRNKAPIATGLAGFGYLLLIASVYFFSVAFKTSPEWRSDGSAIYYALSLDQMRLPITGDWLYQFPGLMTLLTHLVIYMELLIPLLLLLPSRKGYLRLAAVILTLLLHLGIGLTLYVGLFYIINIVSVLGLIPSFVMDRLEARFRIKKQALPFRSLPPLPQLLVNSACLALIAVCGMLNLSAVSWFPYQLRGETLYPVNALRLNQYWGMFSPSVLKRDGWFVYHGADSLGRQWDLRLNQDYVDYKKPEHVVSLYKSDRWRKLSENMQSDNYTFLRPLYCKYLLYAWNKNHPEKQLATLNLYYMQKESLPNYKTTPVEKKIFCVCIR